MAVTSITNAQHPNLSNVYPILSWITLTPIRKFYLLLTIWWVKRTPSLPNYLRKIRTVMETLVSSTSCKTYLVKVKIIEPFLSTPVISFWPRMCSMLVKWLTLPNNCILATWSFFKKPVRWQQIYLSTWHLHVPMKYDFDLGFSQQINIMCINLKYTKSTFLSNACSFEDEILKISGGSCPRTLLG